MQLASSFRYGSPMLRADSPLSDDQICRVAPSIFADSKHESRSERYTYIPTIDVLRGSRNEGFQPFMVCQTRVRDQGKREYLCSVVTPSRTSFEATWRADIADLEIGMQRFSHASPLRMTRQKAKCQESAGATSGSP